MAAIMALLGSFDVSEGPGPGVPAPPEVVVLAAVGREAL